MKKKCFIFLMVLLFGFSFDTEAKAEQKEEWQNELSLEQADLSLQENTKQSFSLQQYVTDVMDGTADFSFGAIVDCICEQVTGQWDAQKKTILHILALSVFAGIFVKFAGTIGDGDLGETGFFVVFLLLFSLVLSGFLGVYSVAEKALENLIGFMKALIPSFSLTLCYGGKMQSSLAFYEAMLLAMGLLSMAMKYFLMPGVEIYFFLSVINQMAGHRFSKMVDLIGSILRMSIRILFAAMIGYQGIQGLLVPVMDRVRNNAVWNVAKGMPGVGNTAGSVMDTVYGSGLLIKSAVGVGGVIAIVILCLYPMMKVFLFTFLYRVAGAVAQPVSDHRIVMVLQSAADVRVFTGIRTYVFTVDSHCVSQYKSWVMTGERRFHGSSISDGEAGCSIFTACGTSHKFIYGNGIQKVFYLCDKFDCYFTCACSGAWLFWKRKGMGKKLYSFGKQTAGGTDERGNSSAWRKV